MSESVTRHSGGYVIPKNVVPLNLMEHAKRIDFSDEDIAKRVENFTALFSGFNERLEQIAHQRGIEFIPLERKIEFSPQGLPNFRSLLDEFSLRLQEFK